MNRSRGLIFIAILILLLPTLVSAQTESSAGISGLDTGNFPRILIYFTALDDSSKPIQGLQPANLLVLEDDQIIPAQNLTHARPGVQFVTALNPGPSFGIRNSRAVSRYDVIVEALGEWAKSRQGTTIDDLSMVVTNGPEINHVSNPLEWQAVLNESQINLREARPSLDTLSRAIDLASDAPARPGMGRAVLLVTPPLEQGEAQAIDDLSARAIQQGVRIFVWMITKTGASPAESTDPLVALAEKTGGQFFAYAEDTPLPDLESYLEPLREVYILEYDSKIKAGGAHQAYLELLTEDAKLVTSPQTFEVNLQPPDPAFIAPPLEIRRIPPAEEDGNVSEDIPLSDYLPSDQSIQILVSFPDERVRSLARTALYVDGKLAAENLKPPFDRFTWDLKDYTANGKHILKAEAEDSLGLVGSSIDHQVQIFVETPRSSPYAWLYRNAPILSLLAVLLAGAVLLLVLVLGGKIRPAIPGRGQRRARATDPVTQPVPANSDLKARRKTGWVNRLQWPQRHVAPKAYAFLARISEGDNLDSATPIPITAAEITLGSDPQKASLVLSDPSIEGLHARLTRQADDSFRLADEGSVAGTWVNYTPVSQEGTKLEHGDLVHIGRIGFRFTLRQPGQVRKPVITLEK